MGTTHIAELLVPLLLRAFKNRHPRRHLQITNETSTKAVERVAQWLREKLPSFTPDPWNGDPLAQAQYACDAFERLTRPVAELEYLLGFTDTPTIRKAHQFFLPLSGTAEYIDVPSGSLYQSVRELLASPIFHSIDDSPYPSAELRMDREFGTAQLRPLEADREALLSFEKQTALVEKMWSHCRQFSDLDADVLDFAYTEWLSQAQTVDDVAVLDLNKVLEIRGIRQQSKGKGRKAYSSEQRAQIAQSLNRIESLWMQITWLELHTKSRVKGRINTKEAIETRAIVISDRSGQLNLNQRLDARLIVIKPGLLFSMLLLGPGRQIAILSEKALKYNPYTQQVEKRLTRYLAWLWRIRAVRADYFQPHRVATLLPHLGGSLNVRVPSHTKKRLEKALDVLSDDRVIRTWQYGNWDEAAMSRKMWGNEWLRASILIEPPEAITDRYADIERHAPKRTPGREESLLSVRVKEQRLKLRLSRLRLAEELNIPPAQLIKVELGRPVAGDCRQKIKKWLAKAG